MSIACADACDPLSLYIPFPSCTLYILFSRSARFSLFPFSLSLSLSPSLFRRARNYALML